MRDRVRVVDPVELVAGATGVVGTGGRVGARVGAGVGAGAGTGGGGLGAVSVDTPQFLFGGCLGGGIFSRWGSRSGTVTTIVVTELIECQ